MLLFKRIVCQDTIYCVQTYKTCSGLQEVDHQKWITRQNNVFSALPPSLNFNKSAFTFVHKTKQKKIENELIHAQAYIDSSLFIFANLFLDRKYVEFSVSLDISLSLDFYSR